MVKCHLFFTVALRWSIVSASINTVALRQGIVSTSINTLALNQKTDGVVVAVVACPLLTVVKNLMSFRVAKKG